VLQVGRTLDIHHMRLVFLPQHAQEHAGAIEEAWF
jgi:hypothetical protein